jgi:hypothetical protein
MIIIKIIEKKRIKIKKKEKGNKTKNLFTSNNN